MRRFFCWLSAGLLPALLTLAGGSAAHATDRGDVDAYLRQVARAGARPGGYVDPAVVAQGMLSSQQADTVLAQARLQRSALHVFVLPVERLRVDQAGVTGAHLAYRPPALVARLHRLVGKPGTYAVLTSAPTQRAGQSFYAYQWPGSGPSYAVGAAVRRAIACCAPDYHSMLRRFVVLSSRTRSGGGSGSGSLPPPGFTDEASSGSSGMPGLLAVGVLGLILAAGVGVVATIAGRGSRRTGTPAGLTSANVAELRAPLGEEIEQMRQQISVADTSTPTTAPDDPGARRVAAARVALDQAHARLALMVSPADARAVTSALADARYEVAAALAVREGRPVPERTPPCFVDPRHGPSVTTRAYPPAGLTTPVPVCAACDASLAAGSAPPARSLLFNGTRMYPWTAYGPAWWYLTGYWGQQPFLDDLQHHAAFSDGGAPHLAGATGGGGWFGGGGGGGGGAHHGGGGGFGGGGHHGGLGGGGLGGGIGGGGHHGGGGGFGGGGGGGGGGHQG